MAQDRSDYFAITAAPEAEPVQPVQPGPAQYSVAKYNDLLKSVRHQTHRLLEAADSVVGLRDYEKLNEFMNAVSVALTTAMSLGAKIEAQTGLLDHLIKSAAQLDEVGTAEAEQAVEGVEAVLAACEDGLISDADVLGKLTAVAGFLDRGGQTEAADLLDKISLAYMEPAPEPSRSETRKDLYDSKKHRDESMWENTKSEVRENRRQHHLENFRSTAPSLSTRYDPELPGVPLLPVSSGVYQSSLSRKIYDFNKGFTLSDGSKYPGGSVDLQTPAISSVHTGPRIFDSRQEYNTRRS